MAPMQFLCKRKISTHSSTPLHGYPTIRLPREFNVLIGETARIYLSEDSDKLAFKVIIDKKVGKICTISEASDLEGRLNDLESEIRDLKSSILKNGDVLDHCNEKGVQCEWARGDSNARPPPCEDGGFGGFRSIF
jgi:hypothetical protein